MKQVRIYITTLLNISGASLLKKYIKIFMKNQQEIGMGG
jgi:hypothetical protein